MAAAKQKWYVIIDPCGCWAVTEPVQAANEIEAIQNNEPEACDEAGNFYRVLEVVGPKYKDFKTSIGLVPSI